MTDSTVVKKLGMKPGQRALLLNAPEAEGAFDLVQVFVRSRADVDALAGAALRAARPGALVWFSYPKGTSKVKTDINRDTGWDVLRAAGWRPVTQIALDETWSALRFRPESEVKSRTLTPPLAPPADGEGLTCCHRERERGILPAFRPAFVERGARPLDFARGDIMVPAK